MIKNVVKYFIESNYPWLYSLLVLKELKTTNILFLNIAFLNYKNTYYSDRLESWALQLGKTGKPRNVSRMDWKAESCV